jgi:hypothetical protein
MGLKLKWTVKDFRNGFTGKVILSRTDPSGGDDDVRSGYGFSDDFLHPLEIIPNRCGPNQLHAGFCQFFGNRGSVGI